MSSLRPSALALAAALSTTLWWAGADARNQNVPQVPNGGELRCETCHELIGNQAGPLNVFGVGTVLTGRDVDWPGTCGLDADGDGFSNGAELGDPDCIWVQGAAPAEPFRSAPGDPASVPGDLPDPEPDAAPDPEPDPDGGPDPEPDAEPMPDPAPDPSPDPAPGPDPDPEPVVDGGPAPDAGPAADAPVISLDDGCAAAADAPSAWWWLLIVAPFCRRRGQPGASSTPRPAPPGSPPA